MAVFLKMRSLKKLIKYAIIEQTQIISTSAPILYIKNDYFEVKTVFLNRWPVAHW